MASAAEVEQVRRALNRLSQTAQAEWAAIWAELGAADRVLAGRALREGWLATIERYGDLTATLGADLFEQMAGELGIRPRVELARGVDEVRASSRLGWALTTADVVGNMRVLLDELVKQPYRSTFQDSALKSGAAWARVPTGADTCSWCRVLASRGAVYHTKQLARFGANGKKYHGDCDCTPILVRGPEDYPKGYDPDALYDEYNIARRSTGSGDMRDIAAGMRVLFGGN